MSRASIEQNTIAKSFGFDVIDKNTSEPSDDLAAEAQVFRKDGVDLWFIGTGGVNVHLPSGRWIAADRIDQRLYYHRAYGDLEEALRVESDKSVRKHVTIVQFFDEVQQHARMIEFLLWFKSADGNNRYTQGTLHNIAIESPHDLIEYVLRYQTSFVRQQWFLLEVSTLSHQSYGTISGGVGILQSVRGPKTIAQ